MYLKLLDTSDYNPQKLPKRAIIYDYTRQPIGIIERKRVSLKAISDNLEQLI